MLLDTKWVLSHLSLALSSTTALLIRVSVRDLVESFTSVQTSTIFQSLDLSCEHTREALPAILNVPGTPLQQDYESQIVSSSQAQQLVKYYLDRTELHPLILPSPLFLCNRALALEIGPRSNEYHPGVLRTLPTVGLARQSDFRIVFSDYSLTSACDSMETLLRDSDLTIWGSVSIVKIADQCHIQVPPAIRGGVLGYSDAHLKLVDFFFWEWTNLSGLKRIEDTLNRYRGVYDVDIYVEFITQPEIWPDTYDLILNLLLRSPSIPDSASRALWHAKLLSCAMNYHLYYPTVLYHLADFNHIFGQFLSKHDISSVPRIFLDSIMNSLAVTNITMSSRRSNLVGKNLNFLREMYPLELYNWYDTGTFWRNRRFRARRHCEKKFTWPSCQRCSINELLDWWASFNKLGEVLFFDPQSFSGPINIIERTDEISCLTWEYFLVRLSDLVLFRTASIRRSGWNWHSADMVGAKLLARTIATNIIYKNLLVCTLPADLTECETGRILASVGIGGWNTRRLVTSYPSSSALLGVLNLRVLYIILKVLMLLTVGFFMQY
jgi:hypothetical protein